MFVAFGDRKKIIDSILKLRQVFTKSA